MQPLTQVIIKTDDGVPHGPYFIEEEDFDTSVRQCLDTEPDLKDKAMVAGWVRSVIGKRSRTYDGPPPSISAVETKP